VPAATPHNQLFAAGSPCYFLLMTRHCHKCGWEFTLSGQPGRGESCHQCGADLKVCLNCASYDPRVAHQCRDRRAEPVAEKHMANYCEWFEMVRRDFRGGAADPREDKARDLLKKLFGD
jgi:hypothetical protein